MISSENFVPTSLDFKRKLKLYQKCSKDEVENKLFKIISNSNFTNYFNLK